jgi:hypothetical protein
VITSKTWKVDLNKYKIISRIFLGANLKFILPNIDNPTIKTVVELKDVVGFIDTTNTKTVIKLLKLSEGGTHIISEQTKGEGNYKERIELL